jgi:hypothetical protein
MKILRTEVNMTWQREKSIPGDKGGIVWVGDYTRGISDVTIFPDKNYEQIDVNFYWKTKGLLMGKVNFAPDEIKEIDPIRIRLSYQDAELLDVDENQIKLFGFNEKKSSWEPLESRVDKAQKRVVGFLKRPGCVALAVAN